RRQRQRLGTPVATCPTHTPAALAFSGTVAAVTAHGRYPHHPPATTTHRRCHRPGRRRSTRRRTPRAPGIGRARRRAIRHPHLRPGTHLDRNPTRIDPRRAAPRTPHL